MTYYYFTKFKALGDDMIIIFEQGKISEPVCILNKENMKNLLREWNQEVNK